MNKTVTLCLKIYYRLSNTSFKPTKFQCSEHSPQVKLLQLHESFQLKSHNQTLPQRRGGSRGWVQGVRTPPPWDFLQFSNTTGILPKKNTMWFIGVEVEQEASAPPPKKILDPPLQRKQVKFYRFNSDRWIRLISINRFLSIYRMIFRYQFLSNDYARQYFKRIGLKTLNWLLLKINLLCTLNLNGFQCFIQHFAWSQTNVWSFEGLWAVLWMTNYT